MIASPFLESSTAPEAPCPNQNLLNKEFTFYWKVEEKFTSPRGGSLFYAFLIVSLLILAFGILWIILSIVKILEQVKVDHEDTIDERPEEKFSRVWLFSVSSYFKEKSLK